jgi:hypothetical protein
MPKKTSKKKSAKAESMSVGALNPLRAGMPAVDSIVEVKPFVRAQAEGPEAAAVAKYKIIRTIEIDGYDKEATSMETIMETFAAEPEVAGDNFNGTSRKAAKLSIANATMENFNDLKTLVNTLEAHEDMVDHHPKIKTTATSNRVAEEKRNVKVKAFLYAASREDDNDYHLIIGRDPEKTPELYMTMELSGLPSSNSASFPKLNAARDAFKDFFEDDLPGKTYDFYDPPIPVRIEGSLFWDASHASGTRPGPKSLKSRMPVVWEVHPITKIVLEP